ncbi:hypothetical protein MCNS_55270 [Mycobacterium conspicuum]|uniref:Uncharacterized protein n=1 Tax=Mycobacterium conspicuum TaxID=44010 RepID=A0A7I7YMY3_9MYCO|nr:hypothetical protein MCNS_55270 [Mycobacterium conspicuum]
MKGPADTADINGLSRLADRDAPAPGRSQRMTAANAAAHKHRKHSGQKHRTHPNPPKPHVPIVAAPAILDK